jgi:hypothetical protein
MPDDDSPCAFDQAATHARLRSLLPGGNDAELGLVAYRTGHPGPPTETDAYRRRTRAGRMPRATLSIWIAWRLGLSSPHSRQRLAWSMTLNPRANRAPGNRMRRIEIQGRCRPGGHGQPPPPTRCRSDPGRDLERGLFRHEDLRARDAYVCAPSTTREATDWVSDTPDPRGVWPGQGWDGIWTVASFLPLVASRSNGRRLFIQHGLCGRSNRSSPRRARGSPRPSADRR